MKILWMSDMDLMGSGYFNVSTALCTGLIEKGYDVKAVGLGYRGEEHTFNFGVIPTANMPDAMALIQNTKILWNFDVLVVALDIWMHQSILTQIQGRPFKYVGIMPVESDPLCMDWAMVMGGMDKPLIISEFGTQEAHNMGIMNAEFIPVGVTPTQWRPPIDDERQNLRKAFGVDENDFVVLTVADNQERKNLSRSMEIFADFAKDLPNAKYILVTREYMGLGWKLREYAQEVGITSKIMIFERGIPFNILWGLYALSDCFLLTSKAEGAGMPIYEALSMGMPVIGTNCTGIKEALSDNRGLLIDVDYVHRDPFGNGRRYFASREHGVMLLKSVYDKTANIDFAGAKKFLETRTWERSVEVLDNALQEIMK